MGQPEQPPSPEQEFLANMRAKLAQTPRHDRPALVSLNISAMQRREREIIAWAMRDDDSPQPHPGLTGLGIALIVAKLFTMREQALAALS